jgi:enoyl-CoA hydratase
MDEAAQPPLVEAEDRSGIRILRLCRPPVNALDLALAGEVLHAIEKAREDPQCEGVILTGIPGVFSAGIDTREVPAYGAAKHAEMLRTINRLVLALYGFPKPVVAAISGHMLGGAFILALACDARLAAQGTFRLGLTEAEAAIPFPAGPLAIVRAELSPAQIRVLALGALSAGPDAAIFAGILDRVVEPAELVEAAMREALRLVALPGFGRVKRQLRADTVELLARIVEHDEEPLLEGWV